MEANSKNNSSADSGGAQLIIDLTETDIPLGTDVYVYVVGLVIDTYYYLDSNGVPTEMSMDDNTQAESTFPGMTSLPPATQDAIKVSYPLPWADYSIKVEVGSNLILNLSQINTTNCPDLGTGTSAFSGRIYLSVGVPKLPFTVQTGGYAAPVYGSGTGVTGSVTLYDWIEFSFDSNGNFNGNPTQVNQFGFPIYLSGESSDGTAMSVQGKYNTSRKDIMSYFNGLTSGYGGAAIMTPVTADMAPAFPANLDFLRAIAPVSLDAVVNNPGPIQSWLSAFFSSDLTTAYSAWAKTPLVTNDVSTGYYSGVVFPVSGAQIDTPSGYPAGSLAFYQGKYEKMSDLEAAIKAAKKKKEDLLPAFYLTSTSSNTITSNDLWQCEGSVASGGTAQKNVGKMIAAAFNRGMIVDAAGNVATSLDDGTCAKQVKKFYGKGTKFNSWAHKFHKVSSNGLAYGFPYDDVCDQNPSIPAQGQTFHAASVRVTLGTFFS